MVLGAVNAKPHRLAVMLGWRRLLFTLATAVLFGLMLGHSSLSPTATVVARAVLVGLVAMIAFGLVEQWPARLPKWLARWVLQLMAVAIAVPLASLLAYWVTLGGNPQFAQNPARMSGFGTLTGVGVLVALWVSLGAMVRQRDASVRNQAQGRAPRLIPRGGVCDRSCR